MTDPDQQSSRRRALAEIFDPRAGSWSPIPNMAVGRALAPDSAPLLPDGSVLVVGGDAADGQRSTSQRFDPETGTWSAPVAMPEQQCAVATALLPDGRVLAAGGTDCVSPGHTLRSAHLYQYLRTPTPTPT